MLRKQIFRFLIVGGSATILDFGIMILLTEIFSVNYLLSSSISFSISVVYNYGLSTKWVFLCDTQKKTSWKFTVFAALSIVGLMLNLLFMWIFTENLGFSYMISKAGATALVMIYNFISRKLLLEN